MKNFKWQEIEINIFIFYTIKYFTNNFCSKISYNVIHKFYSEATIINEISQTILFYLAFWDFITTPYKENLARVVVCQGIIDCPFDSADFMNWFAPYASLLRMF